MAVRSPFLTAIGYVNSYFHWDFPKFNISCVTMSRRPQYLVDSPEERCISKGRSAAITVDYWAADIRTLATKCCYDSMRIRDVREHVPYSNLQEAKPMHTWPSLLRT